MKTTYISTLGVANATRRSVIQMQSELATLQKEVTTGRAADLGLKLGARTGRTVALRQESASLQAFMDANAVASTRLSTSQATLGEIAGDAQRFLGLLIDAKSASSSGAVTAGHAGETLSALIAKLNSSQRDEYIFAGANTDVKPVAEYDAPASPAKQAVANAFAAHFGFAQGDPAASGITAADMQSFLDTDFAALFSDPAWSTNWSSATSQPIRNRISPTEEVATSATANDPPMRNLAMAYAMVADLGLARLSQGAYDAVIDTATNLVGGSIQGLTATQAQLGYSEQSIAKASERMSIQKDVLDKHIGELEDVDPYEASTRINNLLTQIETSYALTARIQKLSLLDYI